MNLRKVQSILKTGVSPDNEFEKYFNIIPILLLILNILLIITYYY